jgi:RNA-binding protein
VPEPTNPKKKSLMPSSPLRRALRAAGHHLSAIVQVGKEGVTDPVIRQLDDALEHHELVKVKVGTESPEDRFEVAEALAQRAGAQIAQVLGRTVLAYRRHPERPRFEAGPPPAAAGDDGPATARSRRPAPARRRAAAPPRASGRPAAKGRPSRGGPGAAGRKPSRRAPRGR